ncbi:hypothetical protein PoB_000890100 [Plakobranchus ocellatus]|uniref:Reverse transcriptase domain-containing protein n=1 Tax=Plakobranchus ocellatus TaxID=259542 RepID=A0AAV3YGT8_9GAST|nr:hypothetical protein PoB_000890100 [Plakobranchus ocellatus]
MGVIEKATGPTPWVSPLVIVPKPKNPDEMRAPNTAIRREKHNTPTLNELSTTLADAKYFIRIDLNQGYNQLELNEESRYITTFATHRGLYCYKRLNFGVNSAAEIFQEVIRQTLNGLSGVINVSDDILVYGKSKEVHNQNLRKVLERLRSKNLTLNKKKFEFMKPSREFLENFFSAEVFKPCPSKLQKIYTQVYVDASSVGISAIFTQTDEEKPQIVQISSRSLTKTEQRYFQTERKALTVTWACEHFHIYLFGAPRFTVYTDHKPLMSLFGSPKIQLPARIERWMMRTQAYNMAINYKPGKDKPADYLSRHPNKSTKPSSREQKIAEEYVNHLAYNNIPKAMTLENIQSQKHSKTEHYRQ